MKKSLFFLFASLLTAGCSIAPDLADRVKNMLVQTSAVENINFSNYLTFAIPSDTLGLLSNVSEDSIITGNYARATTEKIIEGMLEGGYERVEISGDPDLGIIAYILDNQGVFQSYNYAGNFGYPGNFFPGYYGIGGAGGVGGY